jgi:cob(I)alamin adenosyltransferase
VLPSIPKNICEFLCCHNSHNVLISNSLKYLSIMVIYTKRGDKGETSRYDSASTQKIRIRKDSLIVEVLGAIDELNSFLGVAKAGTKDKSLSFSIGEIQRNLLTIGSITGGSNLRFSSIQTKKLEALIDKLEGTLPVLKNFIVPGGSLTAAELQYARALSRRVERRMVALSKETLIKPQILQYLNRLSDVMFMLARKANHDVGVKDEVWVRRKK